MSLYIQFIPFVPLYVDVYISVKLDPWLISGLSRYLDEATREDISKLIDYMDPLATTHITPRGRLNKPVCIVYGLYSTSREGLILLVFLSTSEPGRANTNLTQFPFGWYRFSRPYDHLRVLGLLKEKNICHIWHYMTHNDVTVT